MEQTPIVDQGSKDSQPLWRQLLGAVIGGALALGLYYGYEVVRPQVSAYLTLPVAEGGRLYDLGASHIADKTMDEGNRKRILSRNLRAAGTIQDNTRNDPALLETADNHALDIAWPGHDEKNPKYAEVMGIDPKAKPNTEEIGDAALQPADAMLEEEMATEEMATGDEWENLWGDIRKREQADDAVASNADDLPGTGFGLGFVAAGALGGAAGTRFRKRLRKFLGR